MRGQTKQRVLVSAIVVVAVVLDQLLKVYIKTHFMLGEAHPVTSWFWLCFVENNGMAFGIEWFSKLALTLFRIVVVGLIGWFVHRLIVQQTAGKMLRTGYLVSLACVIAGALGNIIDCVFYGKVVDMFYFPLIHNSAGEVIFFRPVFNLADSFITCAVAVLLIFYHRDLNESLNGLEWRPKKSEKA